MALTQSAEPQFEVRFIAHFCTDVDEVEEKVEFAGCEGVGAAAQQTLASGQRVRDRLLLQRSINAPKQLNEIIPFFSAAFRQ